jgi:hypothetical protein
LPQTRGAHAVALSCRAPPIPPIDKSPSTAPIRWGLTQY